MIQEVDGATAPDDALAEMWLVEHEARAEASGGSPLPTLAERVARYRNPGGSLRRRWLSRVDGEPAGLAVLERFGASLVTGEVLVRPTFRRRGLGRELFDVLCAGAREAEAPMFFGHHATLAGAAFARAVGAVDDQRDVKSILELRTAELPEPPDVDLRSWVGRVPDELADSFVRARSFMSDAPTPGDIEEEPWTMERQHDEDEMLLRRGTPGYTTVILEEGEVVAFTGIRVGAAPCPYVSTDDTAVVPAARGRGLAYAVKLANLRWLREARPDVERVGTMNAELNHAMRAVNTRLGFVPTVTLTTAVVTL